MTMSDQQMKEYAAALIRRHIMAVGAVSVHDYLEERMTEAHDEDPMVVLPSRDEFARLRNQILDLARAALITITWPEDAPAEDQDPMPVFVLKGKDALAPHIIDLYRSQCIRSGLNDQAVQVEHAWEEISAWQDRHRDQVRLPDHVHQPAKKRGSRGD